ncbi:hypothetical protein [Phytohabitans suffuscus]|uniref:Uncharacterized protein n=1 Tax=Phytohabitans suffuscus TaxID=624315 RepID=A0A6F8YDE0_9ACTN|nr:hypothetical protein [Phytohabitans suffuscus]BCB84077.1 hypothetical protein Psuf_013900 [Phytohabitans suffuscus]
MNRPITKKAALTGLAVAGVLSVGIAAPIAAYAADRDGRPPAASYGYGNGEGNGYGPSRHGNGDGKDRAAHDAEFAAALAKELGVPEDKVAEALSKVREQLRPEGKPGEGRGRGDHGPRGGGEPPSSPAPTPTK